MEVDVLSIFIVLGLKLEVGMKVDGGIVFYVDEIG